LTQPVATHGKRFRLPAGTSVGLVHLRVADFPACLSFYCALLGLGVVRRLGNVVHLGASENGLPMLVLEERRGMRRSHPVAAGLYHAAILMPNRPALGGVVRRLIGQRYPLSGAADHGVSEAVYLSDPEGNGLELYADKPRERWKRNLDEIEMTTLPLDLDELVESASSAGDGVSARVPAGTRLGHIHLRVQDLGSSEWFYSDLVGFEVTTRAYGGALFLAAGDYHHHIGVNVWAGTHIRRAPEEGPGLAAYQITVGRPEALRALRTRLGETGLKLRPAESGFGLLDPSGITVVFR
jgi:catechol 2,3-dioxygenase